MVSHELEFCPNRIALYKDPCKISKKVVEIPCKEWPVVGDSLLENDSNVSGAAEGAMPREVCLNHSSKLSNIGLTSSDLSSADADLSGSQCFGTKTKIINDKGMFFELENLGVIIDPKCGGCKCAACPIPGSKYSFSEQKQFDIIQKNLFYDESLKKWFTQYSWKLPRDTLPRNYKVALQNFHAI